MRRDLFISSAKGCTYTTAARGADADADTEVDTDGA